LIDLLGQFKSTKSIVRQRRAFFPQDD